MAIPASTSSWAVLEAGGKRLGSRSARLSSASSRRPIRSSRRYFKIAHMRGIQTVTVLFERHPRCVERLRREAEVARGQRDLGLDTPSAGYGFFRTEGPCSAPQQFLCSRVFAELHHRDASKCERWRIVSQGDSLQCSERITCCERTCCSSD